MIFNFRKRVFKYLFATIFISVFFFSPTNIARAEVQKIALPNDLNLATSITNPIQKIIFSPVKINSVLKMNNDSYAKEVSYFFYKFGFKSSPVSFVLFQNGEVKSLNEDWKINQFSNSESTGILFVLLAYENEFSGNNFQNALANFYNSVLLSEIKNIDVASTSDISMKKFEIQRSDDSSSIAFSDLAADISNGSDILNMISGLDFKNKNTPELQIRKIDSNSSIDPDIFTTLKIEVENNSDFDIIFSSQKSLKFTFKEDSELFSNDKWLDNKTALVLENGYIKSRSAGSFDIPIHSPLLPDSIQDSIAISINDKTLHSKDFSLTIKDTGQKVLKILESGLGYVNLRDNSSLDSNEIAKLPTGEIYIFTDIQNNFYKINFDGKIGWVSGDYIEEIK